jgi:hypothetical protein
VLVVTGLLAAVLVAAALDEAVLVVDPPEPAPAAGRRGSVTSMYVAPREPGSASTSSAARHFAAASLLSPK